MCWEKWLHLAEKYLKKKSKPKINNPIKNTARQDKTFIICLLIF